MQKHRLAVPQGQSSACVRMINVFWKFIMNLVGISHIPSVAIPPPPPQTQKIARSDIPSSFSRKKKKSKSNLCKYSRWITSRPTQRALSAVSLQTSRSRLLSEGQTDMFVHLAGFLIRILMTRRLRVSQLGLSIHTPSCSGKK